MAGKLGTEITQDGEITVLKLVGPVDSATLNDFKDALDPLSKKARIKLLLDCSDLTYMNSRSVGLMTSARRRVYAGGGRMAICNLDKKIVRTLDLLGLGKVIKVYDCREDAVKDLAAVG